MTKVLAGHLLTSRATGRMNFANGNLSNVYCSESQLRERKMGTFNIVIFALSKLSDFDPYSQKAKKSAMSTRPINFFKFDTQE